MTLDLCRDPEFEDVLEDGFLGSAMITAQDGTTRFGVQSIVEITSNESAVFSSVGTPSSHAARRLYVPLFRASLGQGNGLSGDTGISVSVANAPTGEERKDVILCVALACVVTSAGSEVLLCSRALCSPRAPPDSAVVIVDNAAGRVDQLGHIATVVPNIARGPSQVVPAARWRVRTAVDVDARSGTQ